MHELIIEFAMSAADVASSIIVVVLANQYLTWHLGEKIQLDDARTLVPEVQWFDLEVLEQHGYQPHFGDHRDEMRSPKFHKSTECIAIHWQICSPIGSPRRRGLSEKRIHDRGNSRRRGSTWSYNRPRSESPRIH